VIAPPPAGGHDKLRIVTVPAGSTWLRIVHRRYPSALFFGKGAEARWNDPIGDYGVLYLADALETAFAETFGHDVPQRRPPAADKFIDTHELEERDLFRIVCSRPLRIGLLHGAGLAALNLDVGLLASMDYRGPQDWSRWIYEASEAVDGIRYPSRLLPDGENTALFERCCGALAEHRLGSVLQWQHPESGKDIFDVLDEQGWGLL